MYKVKTKRMKRCKNWTCEKCANDNDSENFDNMVNDIEKECESLINQYTVSDVDVEEKFKNMSFNPLRYESIDKNEISNDCHYHECSYITPDRLSQLCL